MHVRLPQIIYYNLSSTLIKEGTIPKLQLDKIPFFSKKKFF